MVKVCALINICSVWLGSHYFLVLYERQCWTKIVGRLSKVEDEIVVITRVSLVDEKSGGFCWKLGSFFWLHYPPFSIIDDVALLSFYNGK